MRALVAAERLGCRGGMERYLDIVLPALAARGVEVHVAAREIEALPGGVTAERVAWSDEHDAPDPAARARVEAALRERAPDVAIAHNVMDAGIVEAMRAARRLVYHVHDHRPFCPNGDRVFPRTGRNCVEPLGRPCALHAVLDGCAYGARRGTLALIGRRERLRDAIAAADAVVVASGNVRDRAARSGISERRLVEIPLPLPDEAYAEHPRPSDARAVLFVGRVVAQKGAVDLVEAVARLAAPSRPVVRIAGEGPELPELRRRAARLGVALEALGTIDAEAVRAAMDAAAVVVVPSRWAEPFGYVGIEAFARGRPVVAAAVGGVGNWLRDRSNGIAVPPRDPAALARALVTLLDDHALRARYGEAARADAERFRAPAIVDALMTLLLSREA